MERLGEYAISVVVAAVLVGIVRMISGKTGAASRMIQLLSGLVMTFTVIAPLKTLELPTWEDIVLLPQTQVEDAVTAGENLSSNAIAAIIKQETEAYILDKAAQFGAALSVEVMVEGQPFPTPTQVLLRGSAAPYAKAQLRRMICDELGVLEVNQHWIG